jgi:hypothetical protein
LLQLSLVGNFKRSFKLYEFCKDITSSEKFLAFLDALEQSRNFSALRILDPDRPINLVPDKVNIPPRPDTSGQIYRSYGKGIIKSINDLACVLIFGLKVFIMYVIEE